MSLLPNHPKRVAARARLARAKAARTHLRLTHPLPTRHWERTGDGWVSTPWTESTALSALQAGGWFKFEAGHSHDFASPQAARFARAAQDSLLQLTTTESH